MENVGRGTHVEGWSGYKVPIDGSNKIQDANTALEGPTVIYGTFQKLN